MSTEAVSGSRGWRISHPARTKMLGRRRDHATSLKRSDRGIFLSSRPLELAVLGKTKRNETKQQTNNKKRKTKKRKTATS